MAGAQKRGVIALAVTAFLASLPAFAFDTSGSKNFSAPANAPAYFSGETAPVNNQAPPAPAAVHTGGPVSVAAPSPRTDIAPPATARSVAPDRPAPTIVATPRLPTVATHDRTARSTGRAHVAHADPRARNHGGRAEPLHAHHANSGRAGATAHARSPSRVGIAPGKSRGRTARIARRHA
jgi:hypothetical protein